MSKTFAVVQDGRLHQVLVTDDDPRTHVHADIVVVEITDVKPAPQEGWSWDGEAFAPPPSPPELPLATVQAGLCLAIDREAEAQRARYVTDGSGQAMVYLQKQTQAAQALSGAAATPAVTAGQGAALYALLAAEIGITIDPSTKAPAIDVFGVARAVAATVQAWLPMAAAIEKARLSAKVAINAATTAEAARAARAAAVWPG